MATQEFQIKKAQIEKQKEKFIGEIAHKLGEIKQVQDEEIENSKIDILS